jgi:hypothetical protein
MANMHVCTFEARSRFGVLSERKANNTAKQGIHPKTRQEALGYSIKAVDHCSLHVHLESIGLSISTPELWIYVYPNPNLDV